jgi:hypothetical protein
MVAEVVTPVLTLVGIILTLALGAESGRQSRERKALQVEAEVLRSLEGTGVDTRDLRTRLQRRLERYLAHESAREDVPSLLSVGWRLATGLLILGFVVWAAVVIHWREGLGTVVVAAAGMLFWLTISGAFLFDGWGRAATRFKKLRLGAGGAG